MRRRKFIRLIGGAAIAAPVLSRAAGAAMPVIGYLGLGSPAEARNVIDRFHRGLSEMGFVEGQNVAIEYRWGEGSYTRMPDLAADLVRQRVAVICTTSNVGTLAAKAATSDIPIVFVFGIDPVRTGLVSSLNRPGGNATGVAFLTSALEPKRFELVHELLPRVTLVAALINPSNVNAESHAQDLEAAARTFGLHLLLLRASNVADIDMSFTRLVQERAGALLLTSDPVFEWQRRHLVDLATRNAIPTIYPWRDFVDVGGLLSYGNSLTDAARQVGFYAGRILKGDKAGELPIWVPTKFEFVVSLKTAKALGITVPPSILARADEVIE